MCTYCGCQSLRTIDELTREHDAALALVRDAEQAAEADDHGAAADTCAALAALLEPHTAVEEEAVFPAMAREHAAHVAGLVHEHVLVHEALHELTVDETPRPGWPARLSAGLHVLREHIAKEQDGLFPAALTSLTAGDWERAEGVRTRVGSPLADHGAAVVKAEQG